ncbi:SAM-dependent methyltransferase, partial [Thermodesulfobacteriota bacterium]
YLAWELTRETIVIEFVGPEDSMFQHLLRGRGHLFKDLNIDVFETVCSRYFHIEKKHPIADSHRCLYLLRKKATQEAG